MSLEETRGDTEGPSGEPKNDSDSQYEDVEDDEVNVEAAAPELELESEAKGDEKAAAKKDPANIPRKGYFFEHDNRDGDDDNAKEKRPGQRRRFERFSAARGNINDKWTHDRFDERQQQPKSRSELVKRYGYDIREEKSASAPKTTSDENKRDKKALDREDESDEDVCKRRDDIVQNSDDEDFGQRLANLRRRKTAPPNERNFDEYKINNNSNNNKSNHFKQVAYTFLSLANLAPLKLPICFHLKIAAECT
jgi:hypothetical protein